MWSSLFSYGILTQGITLITFTIIKLFFSFVTGICIQASLGQVVTFLTKMLTCVFLRTGKITLSVKSFPYKYEDMTLILQTHVKKARHGNANLMFHLESDRTLQLTGQAVLSIGGLHDSENSSHFSFPKAWSSIKKISTYITVLHCFSSLLTIILFLGFIIISEWNRERNLEGCSTFICNFPWTI